MYFLSTSSHLAQNLGISDYTSACFMLLVGWIGPVHTLSCNKQKEFVDMITTTELYNLTVSDLVII